MRNFPLFELHWQDFEKLVVLVCERILGTGTINFSAGPDGGRDAKFTGKAQDFPGKTTPWEGTFVIQAKHTEKPTAKCSDHDFKRILKKEVDNRLKTLVDNHEVDYYLLFTNRKLSGIEDARISNFLETNLEIENRIIGNERIQLWLQEYPDITKTLGLNKLFLPLEFYENDLKDIIVKFSELKEELSETVKSKQEQLKFIDKARKNQLNNLGKDYFEFMKKESLAYFYKIEAFLKDPVNREYRTFYENTTSDLQELVIIRRNEYYKFEELFQDIYSYIMNNNRELKDKRKLVRVFLHYMYWHCDIGIGD